MNPKSEFPATLVQQRGFRVLGSWNLGYENGSSASSYKGIDNRNYTQKKNMFEELPVKIFMLLAPICTKTPLLPSFPAGIQFAVEECKGFPTT